MQAEDGLHAKEWEVAVSQYIFRPLLPHEPAAGEEISIIMLKGLIQNPLKSEVFSMDFGWGSKGSIPLAGVKLGVFPPKLKPAFYFKHAACAESKPTFSASCNMVVSMPSL